MLPYALNQYTQRTVPGNVQIRGEAAPAAIVTASSPDGWDEMSAVTGRVFVAQNPEQFTYDADGNMTSDGRFHYFWNGENRLVCASNSEYVVTYAYDHRERMVTKTLCASASSAPLRDENSSRTLRTLREIKTTTYIWDNWNIIREIVREGDSVAVTDNVWGLDLDGTLQGAGGVEGLLAVVRDDGVFFPTYDANGNVSEYVSTNGEIVAHYDYSPFGEPLVASGPLASSFTHQFSTKPYCAVTGFSEYVYRKYRPDIGRWMSRDPIYSWRTEQLKKYTNVVFSSYCETREQCGPQNNLYFEPSVILSRNLYSFVQNKAIYDILGLYSKEDFFDCSDRCVKMARHVPGNVTFLRNCLIACDKNPKHIPTIPELLTPPAIEPSWKFGDWRGNWKAILDCLRAFWEGIVDP